jgi:hypothetical protein
VRPQSVAPELGFGAGASDEVVDVDAGAELSELPVEAPESDLPESDARESELPALALSPLDDLRLALADLRSILAQPEPLKCTLGATNALRIDAPQTGHVSGLGA